MSTSDFNKNDLIKCHNKQKADIRFQDGALPHAVGTHCFQVVRATQNKDTSMDGFGWSYNHAAMLVFWNEHFYVDYLSGPISEHLPPSHTLLTHSADGASWSKPVVLFPPIEVSTAPYIGPGKEYLTEETVACVMHQRMSFYVTKSNRLLATGYYGISPDHSIAPNKGYGPGRVVREIYADHTFSDIFFLRFNEAAGYNSENTTAYPHFTASSDKEFIEGCKELISNRPVNEQMWEEERLNTSWFTQPGAEALSYYTLPNGNIMGLYKKALVSMSTDGGESWSDKQTDYSLETSTGKVWGQKTSDGRYALAYNPTTDSAHRWPIAVITGENGQDFDHLLAITPEVSPHKYAGLYKNLGPQYIRGICEANPQPKDNMLWLAYTVNKEDVWVSCTPLPIHGQEESCVDTDFQNMPSSSLVPDWNVYAPAWCPVRITKAPDNSNRQMLCLYDSDPYDRSRAMRVFPSTEAVHIKTAVLLESCSEQSNFTIEIQDSCGRVPVRFYFKNNGEIIVKNGGRYSPFGTYEKNKMIDLEIQADCRTNQFTLRITQNDKANTKTFAFSNSVYTLDRILYTSKDNLPFNTIEDCGKYGDLGNLKDADYKLKESRYYIDSLTVKPE